MSEWLTFWNTDHALYVSERHKDAHQKLILSNILEWVPSGDAKVVDFGCAEARYAEVLAQQCGELILCEPADRIRQMLKSRMHSVPTCSVVDGEELRRLPASSIDLIVVNSVVQYLTQRELQDWLGVWRSLAKPGGRLVLADIVPHDTSALSDAVQLLVFAAREKFLVAALSGLVATFFSPYRSTRKKLGLAAYSEAEIRANLDAAGWRSCKMVKNFGHSRSRFAVTAVA